MFVCPTNRLLQEFVESDATTINIFFGISVGDVKREPFDYSEFDLFQWFECILENHIVC